MATALTAVAPAPRARRSATTPPSSGRSPTCCAATTSSPSTARSSCRSPCCAASTACWSRRSRPVLERHAQLAGQGRERRAGPPGGRGRAVLQHLAARLRASCSATRRPSPTTCAHYIAGFSPRRPGRPRQVRLRRPDRPARPGRTCSTWSSSKFAEIDLHPDAVSQRRDGLPLRGADPPVRGALERDGRRALHAARGHPADGQPAVHRGRRRCSRSRGSCKTMLDPACGTGGMLSVAEDHLRALNPDARLRGVRPGAERRDLRHLPLRHDAQGPGRLATSSSATRFTEDGHQGERFDYLLANPPFGVEWKKVEDEVARRGTRRKGFGGRFGAGLPRINDGSLPVPAAHDLAR